MFSFPFSPGMFHLGTGLAEGTRENFLFLGIEILGLLINLCYGDPFKFSWITGDDHTPIGCRCEVRCVFVNFNCVTPETKILFYPETFREFIDVDFRAKNPYLNENSVLSQDEMKIPCSIWIFFRFSGLYYLTKNRFPRMIAEFRDAHWIYIIRVWSSLSGNITFRPYVVVLELFLLGDYLS